MKRIKWIERVVDHVDEYGQGYNVEDKLVLCICGEFRQNADWSDHFCPYNSNEQCDYNEYWMGGN